MAVRYSKNSGYTVARRSYRRPATRTVQRRVTFGPATARYFGLAVLAIIGLLTATQANKGVTRDYQQTALRTKTAQVQSDINALKIEAERAGSLNTIAQSAQKAAMEQVTQVTHVEEGQVAGVSTATVSAP